MAASNVEAIRAEHDAFNDRDWERMRDLFAEDCVFVDATAQSHVGPDGFVEGYSKAWANAFSDGKITETKYHDAGSTVVAEFVGRGFNDGPLGPLPASNRTAAVPYCELYEFDADGK